MKIFSKDEHSSLVSLVMRGKEKSFITLCLIHSVMYSLAKLYKALLHLTGNTKGGSNHCTFDLLFDWFGLVCFANKNKNCQLSYS
jgi:hypothetical protein